MNGADLHRVAVLANTVVRTSWGGAGRRRGGAGRCGAWGVHPVWVARGRHVVACATQSCGPTIPRCRDSIERCRCAVGEQREQHGSAVVTDDERQLSRWGFGLGELPDVAAVPVAGATSRRPGGRPIITPLGDGEVEPRTRSGRLRTLGWAPGVAVLARALLLVLGAWFLSSDVACEVAPGDSDFGAAEWSWLTVGTPCRWTVGLNGFDRLDEPGWVLTIVVAGMALIGMVLVVASLPRPPERRHPAGAPLHHEQDPDGCPAQPSFPPRKFRWATHENVTERAIRGRRPRGSSRLLRARDAPRSRGHCRNGRSAGSSRWRATRNARISQGRGCG